MDMRGLGRLILGISVLAVGCNTGEADGDGSGGGDGETSFSPTTTLPPTTTNATDNDSLGTMGGSMGQPDSSGTMGPTSSDDDPTAATMPPIFDVNEMPDAPAPMEGCGSVDFLFVIDNSGSMSAQQTQLLASFPGFISAITASLDETVDSFHLGVVTSDNYSGNEPGCTTIGNLVTRTGGFGSSNQDCSPLLTPGNRFATEMDDIEAAFNCMAQVGTSGSGIEQPVTATIAAVDPSNGAPGACNEGFLRDEAILVVVIITDDPPWAPDFDDAHPMTNTTTWYDDIVAAKNGDPEAMVVLGFVPWMDTTCVFQNLESPNLINFVQEFGDQGVLASICEADFGPTFASTVETIVTTCENFEPPA